MRCELRKADHAFVSEPEGVTTAKHSIMLPMKSLLAAFVGAVLETVQIIASRSGPLSVMQHDKFLPPLLPSVLGIPNNLYISIFVFMVFAWMAFYNRRRPKGWVAALLAGGLVPLIFIIVI